jgi:hypothetical protein
MSGAVVLARQRAVDSFLPIVSGWEFANATSPGHRHRCRAAHQVSLADEQGRFVWTGHRFRTTPQDLARLWAMLLDGTDPVTDPWRGGIRR